MPKTNSTDPIKHFKQGERLTAQWTKDVADRFNSERRDFDLLVLGTFYGKFTADLPGYRCLYVSTTQSASIRSNVLELACVDAVGSSFKRVVTNGPKPLKANVAGEVQFVGNTPVMLETNETSFTPGDTCGPTTNGFVAKTEKGLIALLNVFTIDSKKYSWFIADAGAGGSLVRLFMTPSGGIAAQSSATCTEYSETFTSLGTTQVVWNHRSSVVAGSVIVLVMAGATRLWVVEGNCPIDIVEPPDPEEPPVGEP